MSSQVLRQLTDAISLRLLQTPLEGSVCFALSAPVQSVRTALREKNFDQAPVVEDDVPIGFVLLRDLHDARGSIEPFVRKTFPARLASDMTTLETALPWLADEGFLFVLSQRTVTGFVVPSDINKQAGRTYFFLALAQLELQLADALRRTMEDQAPLLDHLSSKDRSTVRRRMKENRDANVEADVVAELTMPQLFTIIGGLPELRTRLERDREWGSLWKQLCTVRNRVAHPARPLLQKQGELHHLVDILTQVQQLQSDLALT